MTPFDPNDPLDSQEQADAYINWCAENFLRLHASGRYTYRTGIRAAAWLHVVAVAQLHLDDDVTDDRETLLRQLTVHQNVARLIERQQEKLPIERLLVVRSTFDCWEPVGRYAAHLLNTARCALMAIIIIDLHPLIDLWEVQAPDVWALLDAGAVWLSQINEHASSLEYDDYAVRPNDDVIAKMTWQQVNNLVRHAGLQAPLSPN